MHEQTFIVDITLIFVSALLGGFLAERLRQSPIVGYILGGLMVGPYTTGLVQDLALVQNFADIGVVLLMFTLGVEFSLRRLAPVRHIALGGGIAQILLLVAVGAALGLLLGMELSASIYMGCIISISSTMIVMRVLADLGDQGSFHGQVMLGWLIVQDMAVIIMVALLPVLSHSGGANIMDSLKSLLVAVVFIALMLWLAQKMVPRIMERAANLSNPDVFLLLALSMGLGIAFLSERAGLSLSLGAFLAGLVISESAFVHEVMGKVLSLRDAFVIIFFVSVGLLIDPHSLLADWPLFLLLLVCVLFIKFVIFLGTGILFGLHSRPAFIAASGMIQIGEFSFVMAHLGLGNGLVDQSLYNAILAAAIVSILLTPLVMRRAPAWYNQVVRIPILKKWLKTPPISMEEGCEDLRDHIILIGYGRVGRNVGLGLRKLALPMVVVEYNQPVINHLAEQDIPYVFGDAANPVVLTHTRPEQAQMAILTMPDAIQNRLAIQHLRSLNPRLTIIARAHTAWERDILHSAGATDVVQPEAEAGLQMVRRMIRHLDIPSDIISDYLNTIYYADYRNIVDSIFPRPAETLRLREFHLKAGTPLNGNTLACSRIREEIGCSVVAIRHPDGRVVHNPHSSERMQEGDRLLVMGTEGQLVEFCRMKVQNPALAGDR